MTDIASLRSPFGSRWGVIMAGGDGKASPAPHASTHRRRQARSNSARSSAARLRQQPPLFQRGLLFRQA